MQNLRKITKIVIPVLLLIFIFAPVGVMAAEGAFIPCDGPNCGFPELMQLVQNILNWIVMISFPATIITFSYAGFIMLTSGGNSSKKDQAKEMLLKVVIGFAVILSAWLIVRIIVNSVLAPGKGDQFIQLNR